MAARVAVVTDSTSDLAGPRAEREGIRVVPMSVTFGDEDFISGVTLRAEQFYERLTGTDDLPTTAQPNPHWFTEAWHDVRDAGLQAAVSLHVSGELSGTVAQAAGLAASAPLPVTVVDTRQVGGGLALAALGGAREAATGATVRDVLATTEAITSSVVNMVVVDTMEWLRRGGRVSAAGALVGRALRVKPILEVADGRIVPMGRARTTARALQTAVVRLEDAFGQQPLHLVVSHARAPDAAQQAIELARARLQVARVDVHVFGPILATHTGPGAVGLAAVPAALVRER